MLLDVFELGAGIYNDSAGVLFGISAKPVRTTGGGKFNFVPPNPDYLVP